MTLTYGWLELRRLDKSCGWFEFRRLDTSCGWLRATADSVPRLTLSHGWLEFRRLNTSYSWLHPTADSIFSGWIRLRADSILRLTRVLLAWYELQLILSCGWLKFCWLDSTVLYFNIWSKFKDLLCKIHQFYGLFSTAWFQLPLIQALAAAWRSLKKLEEAWKSLRKLEEVSRL